MKNLQDKTIKLTNSHTHRLCCVFTIKLRRYVDKEQSNATSSGLVFNEVWISIMLNSSFNSVARSVLTQS